MYPYLFFYVYLYLFFHAHSINYIALPLHRQARGIDVPHAIAKRWYYHHYHCRHITVRRGDTVSYQWNNLFLRRPGEPVRRFTRVAVLFVCNRLFRYRRFIRNAEGSFGGYGMSKADYEGEGGNGGLVYLSQMTRLGWSSLKLHYVIKAGINHTARYNTTFRPLGLH